MFCWIKNHLRKTGFPNPDSNLLVNSAGDILLSMTYEIERCILTIQVLKARNLRAVDKTGHPDPYCKIREVPSECKYKTRHVMQTLDPEWKETFTFEGIKPNEIHQKHIEFTVWSWDRRSTDRFLGEVTIDLADPIHLDGSSRWYPLVERRPAEPRNTEKGEAAGWPQYDGV